jgi:regulator of sigma E protease
MIDFILRMVITVLTLGFVVVIHEWGHFLVARRLGVRVERFTVGFGPEIFGWTRGETRYAVCIVPLGGMVKMAGEFLDEHTQKPDEFFSQPWYGRATIALAGPVMNYFLAFVLFTGVALGWGTLRPSDQPVIGDMVQGMPAAEAKLQVGDKVRSINGVAVTSWEQMAGIIHTGADKVMKIEVERAVPGQAHPKMVHVALTPRRDAQQGMGLIGIMPHVDKVKVGLVGSIQTSWKDLKVWTLQPLNYISQKIRRWEGPKELSGPLGIAQMVTRATKEGVSYVLYLMAIISTGLGLFNLFPIPILDGGHVLLYVIEGVMRRPINKRAMQVVNAIGLSLILTIFLYASYQDVLRWRLGLWK